MNKSNNWQLTRAGLLDYWYYDEEYFDFSDGRMLIRGQNGSGKSVTMQSFIPLLLDGKKSPERLDPFNSKARKLEDYLLGEHEISGKEVGLGYLFLEFKKRNEDIYASIGMGIKAKRGMGITDSWYFVLNDNRRIGIDIFLYDEVEGEKIALSRKRLENTIGSGGKVLTSQKDYAAEVNKLLFGYDNIEDFEEMIDLIINIRTPKLSRDMKPSTVYEIMQNSLPGLSDDDLRQLSDTIENLDSLQTKLNMIKESYQAASKLKNDYDRYNKFLLYEKMKRYLDIKEALEEKKKEINKLEKKVEDGERAYKRLQMEVEALDSEEELLKIKQEQLREREEYKLAKDLAMLRMEKAESEQKKSKLELKKEVKNRELISLANEIRIIKDEVYSIEKKIDEINEEAVALCEDLKLNHHVEMLEKILDMEFTSLPHMMKEAKELKHAIEKIKSLLEKLEELEQKQDEKEKEKDGKLKEQAFCISQLEQTQLQIEEHKTKAKELVKDYFNRNRYFKLEQDRTISLFQRINAINGKNQQNLLYDVLNEGYNSILSQYTVEREKVNYEIQKTDDAIIECKEQIDRIKKQSEKPYPTEEARILARERLSALGVPHIPFYMAVDFVDGVDDDMKAVIEQGLMDMGILDSLIVPRKYYEVTQYFTEDIKDSVIVPQPKLMCQSLDSYLEVAKLEVEGITQQDVADAIASITLNPDDYSPYLCEDGSYGIGILRGKTSRDYTPKYIGIESRRRHKEQLIREIEDKLQELKDKRESLLSQKQMMEAKIIALKSEYNSFPRFDDLDAAYELLEEYEDKEKDIIREINNLELEINSIKRNMLKLREEITSLTTGIELNQRLDVYREALNNINEYIDILYDMEKYLYQRRNKKELLHHKENSKESLENEIEDIYYEIKDETGRLKNKEERIKQIEELLKDKDIESIEKEIMECVERLKRIPNEKKEKNKLKETQYGENEKNKMELRNMRQHVEELNDKALESSASVEEELSFGFLGDLLDIDLESLCQEKVKEYDELFKGQLDKKEEIITRLNAQLNTNQAALTDFYPNLELKQYVTGGSRLVLSFRAEGSLKTLYQLMEILKLRMDEYEVLIKDEERRLFEDILANSISSKIIAKIRKAQKWIDNMNKIMKDMDTSSGLTFQISWEPKNAEDEDELNTKELVKLLQVDPAVIKDSERRRITAHFMARINRARKYRDDGSSYSALHVIMREILDYRQWYQFRLFYQKTGESRKELSNHAYDIFSGGEKAMSMYVPLFAAIYAKYDNARPDAPKIISMDEAFAGVDENNIENMFGLIQSLDFNFIMNSQALWGDYATIPALTIYELVRSKNSGTVLKVKYKWNGKQRIMEGIG